MRKVVLVAVALAVGYTLSERQSPVAKSVADTVKYVAGFVIGRRSDAN